MINLYDLFRYLKPYRHVAFLTPCLNTDKSKAHIFKISQKMQFPMTDGKHETALAAKNI